MAAISAVVITYNEEKNIERCLTSLLGVADEILVVDSFSTDRTREISERLGARFLEHPFDGHIQQKNYAWTQANCPYVLSLDADEALSEELIVSILSVKPSLDQDGYSFNRLTNYCGKWIWHSGWYPDVKIRLFRKGTGSWGGMNPHDKYLPYNLEKVQHLSGDLLHYTFYSVDEHREQVRKFTDISSRAMFEQGRRSNWFRVVFSPMAKFLRNYVIHRGFLDGREGWLIATISGKATYLKYKKLLKLQNTESHQSN